MKKIILSTALALTTTASFAGDTLKTTYINKTVEPSKTVVKKAAKSLYQALSKTGPSYAVAIENVRQMIEKQSVKKKYSAAIVMTQEQRSGNVKMNITEYEDFLESAEDICYNGNIKTAFEVANLLSDDIWIYDEYSLDDIVIEGNNIIFKVMDEFSYGDQDATEDQRDEFITDYVAGPCK